MNYQIINSKIKKVLRGVSKTVVKKDIEHKDDTHALNADEKID